MASGDPPREPDSDSNWNSAPDEDPMLFCPVCSTRLVQHKCKLICERCGYYMSCADYY
jgi:hypothetical protein